ncbi:MAG: MerR family DNA-binding transcriptional regulator [Promethearchaeota archaeon]
MGVSVVTLRRWDRAGTLNPLRTLGNHRRYS